ncbi:unnamed protein product [Phytophthora fragariaefolia]|uniref:Unnamed protein product n=1 Tax=Phytophthora fragariaefolia TaxID=1490495 RepID=A0A9W6XUL8_9STRA|nr:unnamed protein product [Phytophthora fragariaefolia]
MDRPSQEIKDENQRHLLYDQGVPPTDTAGVELPTQKRSQEEKKRKMNDIIIETKELIEQGREKEVFTKFPKSFLTCGENLKALVTKKGLFQDNPHIWNKGAPGSGKSDILQVGYPSYYNKDLNNSFFDLSQLDVHTHVLLQDLDHETVEKLGVSSSRRFATRQDSPSTRSTRHRNAVTSTSKKRRFNTAMFSMGPFMSSASTYPINFWVCAANSKPEQPRSVRLRQARRDISVLRANIQEGHHQSQTIEGTAENLIIIADDED